jgi:hypothetical protein
VSIKLIDGFVHGLTSKKTADITDTAYFKISFDCEPSGLIELGLYGMIKNLLFCLEETNELCIKLTL